MFAFFKEEYECSNHGYIAHSVIKFNFPEAGDCYFCLRCLHEFFTNAGLNNVKPIKEEKQTLGLK